MSRSLCHLIKITASLINLGPLITLESIRLPPTKSLQHPIGMGMGVINAGSSDGGQPASAHHDGSIICAEFSTVYLKVFSL